MLGDPGYIGFLFFEIAADSVNENGVGFQGAQAAGLFEGENPFQSAVAFIAAGSLAAFSLQDAEADHPFCMVVGWRHALLFEKDPKMGHFPFQSAGEPARFIRVVSISGDELHQPAIECLPLFFRGRGVCHVAQTAEFLTGPATKDCDVRIQALRKSFGVPDQMTQTGLTEADPLAVNVIAVTDEDAFPITNQFLKGFPGPVRVDHEKSRGSVRHNPMSLRPPHPLLLHPAQYPAKPLVLLNLAQILHTVPAR